LEVTVGIEARAVISFGLEVNIEMKAKAIMEVVMENLIVFTTCVWCGVAFLWAWWDTFNPSERSVIVNCLPDPGETRGGSIPSPRTIIYVARFVAVALNKASHGDGFFFAAAPTLQCRACWRRYVNGGQNVFCT
jgi:hypothetical protein